MKRSWTPPPPPKCPRIITQTLPRRPGRLRLKERHDEVQRGRICPPMQLIHPGVMMCLLAEAPRQSHPLAVTDYDCMAPRVPSVFSPLAPPVSTGLPQTDTFGSTLTVPRVGRSGDDGGFPRSITPGTATVIPPLLLQPACKERIAAAAWTHTGPNEAPKPPRRIVVPHHGTTSSIELVKGPRSSFACPEMEGLAALLAAACDLPRFRPRPAEEPATKPLRIKAPPLFSTSCDDTERSDLGGWAWAVHRDVLATFGSAPALELTAGMQEAVYDLPRSVRASSPSSTTAPHVPTVPQPMLGVWMSAGALAVGSGQPNLVVGIVEAASIALGALREDLLGTGSTVKPPQPIKREPVRPRCEFCPGEAPSGSAAENARRSFPPRRGSSPSGEGTLRPEGAEGPVWRDEPGSVYRDTPLWPVWRDSDEWSERRENAPSPSCPYVQELVGHFPPNKDPPKLPKTVRKSDISVSPLRAVLRRKRFQKPTRVSAGSYKIKHKPSWIGEKDCTENVSSCRKQTAGVAVWKDTVTESGRIDHSKLWGFVADTKGSRDTTVDGAVGRSPKSRTLATAVGFGAIPVSPPPRDEKIRPTRRRQAMNTRLARKMGRGARDKSLAFEDFLPIGAQCPAGPRHGKQRGRSTKNIGFLSVATSSAAAVWKSIASIPDDPLTSPRASGYVRTLRRGETRVDQWRSVSLGPFRPPRAPAFEPWHSRDNEQSDSEEQSPIDHVVERCLYSESEEGQDVETLTLPQLKGGWHSGRTAKGTHRANSRLPLLDVDASYEEQRLHGRDEGALLGSPPRS